MAKRRTYSTQFVMLRCIRAYLTASTFLYELLKQVIVLFFYRLSHIPGGAERALTPAARIRLYVIWSAAFGGLAAGLMVIYRTLMRPGTLFGGWTGQWLTWGMGRREL